MRNLKKYVHNKKDKAGMEYLSKNPKAMRDMFKIYNALCPLCKKKKLMMLRRNKNMSLDDMCAKCQESVQMILGGKV